LVTLIGAVNVVWSSSDSQGQTFFVSWDLHFKIGL